MERNLRKTRVGKVVSNKMDKTIVVAIEEHVKHPLYFPGILPQNEQRPNQMEPAICSTPWCLQCADGLWTSFHRR